MIDLILEMGEQRLSARVPNPTGETVFQATDEESTIFADRGVGSTNGGDCYARARVRVMILKELV